MDCESHVPNTGICMCAIAHANGSVRAHMHMRVAHRKWFAHMKNNRLKWVKRFSAKESEQIIQESGFQFVSSISHGSHMAVCSRRKGDVKIHLKKKPYPSCHIPRSYLVSPSCECKWTSNLLKV